MKADSIEVECKWKSINSVRSIAVLIYNNSVKCDFIRLNGIDATNVPKVQNSPKTYHLRAWWLYGKHTDTSVTHTWYASGFCNYIH